LKHHLATELVPPTLFGDLLDYAQRMANIFLRQLNGLPNAAATRAREVRQTADFPTPFHPVKLLLDSTPKGRAGQRGLWPFWRWRNKHGYPRLRMYFINLPSARPGWSAGINRRIATIILTIFVNC
jgi:hypothetical protein